MKNFLKLSAIVFLSVILFATLKPISALALVEDVVPQDDLQITEDTILRQGIYEITDVNQNGIILIKANGITLDCNGAVINGIDYTGFGIYNNGFSNVTIKNCNISRYYYAVRSENSNSVTIQNNNFSGNRLISGNDVFLYINQGPEITPTAHLGGGIYVRNATSVNITGNTLINQQNGIDLYSVSNSNLALNNASDNFGWGVHLAYSTYNTVSNNTADHVNRNCFGTPNGGCDTTGFLLVNGSNYNQVTNNQFRYGGNGFFIGNQASVPSNHNYIANNDGSYATANAFETTFSEDNTFYHNTASNSSYGFWLGYSHHSKLDTNTIENNINDGIAIEHGHSTIIINNTIRNNGQAGINLWTDYDGPDFPDRKYSFDYTITKNNITRNGRNIDLTGTTDSMIKENEICDSAVGLYFRQANINGELVNSQNNKIESNDFFCNTPSQVNIALNKPTNANISPQTAYKAVDGDKVGGLGEPYAGSYTWNPGTLNPGDWWQVDLQTTTTVQTIVIYPYVNNSNDWLDRFHIVVSDTGQFSGEETTILTVTDFPNRAFNSYTINPIQTRYLRIISDEQKGWIQLQEFEVYQEANVEIYTCQYYIYNYQPADVNAKYNWWGTTDTSQINTRIYDKNDNSSVGLVVYAPFLRDPFPRTTKMVTTPATAVDNKRNNVVTQVRTSDNVYALLRVSKGEGYVEANFQPSIPNGSTISLVAFSYEHKESAGITGVAVDVWSGTNWVRYPGTRRDSDTVDDVDVTTQINTEAKAENSKIRFICANSKAKQETCSVDYMGLNIFYIPPTP